jgi:hypothetical protein
MKEMERVLGLSYPTVRARLEEALVAAGLEREGDRTTDGADQAARRAEILDRLESGALTAAQAADQLREVKGRRDR